MIIATKKKKKETSKEEDKNNTWVKATEDTKKIKEVWSDGYDFGDVTKTILGVSKIAKDTTKDALVNIGKGFMSTVEGSVDSIRYGMSDVYRKLAEKNPDQTIMTGGIVLGKPQQISDKLKENAQYEVTKNLLGEENDIFKENWSAKVDEKSVLGNKSDSIFQGVGNVGAFVGMSQLTGGSNLSTFLNSFSSAYGNARTEAYKQGADDKTANRAGWVSGLAEGISEQFFSGIPGMKTAGWGDALNSRLSKAIQKYLGSTAGKVALTFFDGLGEGSEEVISNMLNATFTDIMHYLDKNYTYGMDDMSGNIPKDVFNSAFSQDSLDSFISAMFTSLLTGGGKQIIQNQSNARTSNKVAKQSDMSKSQANEIMEKIAERRANLTLEEDANYKERTEAIESARQQLNKEIRQQIKQGNTVDLNELFNQTPADNTQAQFTFNNDEIKNVRTDKQNVLANDMAKLNNVKSNHDLYKTINAIQSANNTQQYHITTTEGLYNMGIVDKTADGKYVMKDGSPYVPRGLNYKDGDIYINADVGNQSGTQAMYHEMFEGFKKASPTEYNEFKQMVTDIIGEEAIQKEYDAYKSMYGEELTDDIRDEIINDKFGELAESEQFINKIADNRTVLQKFIDTVKDMIKYVKGTQQERELIKLQKKLENKFSELYKETDFSGNKGETAYSLKESKAMLEKQFKDLTGDSLLVAEAKLGNYAFQQIRGNQVEAPYNQEAMDLLEKIQNSKKTSSHLYHSTPADRIQSIAKNGLVVGSKQNQEGVSSANKLYLSATEELADSFTPENSVMLRISPNAKLENLDNDLLGGEGSYTITNNIEPKYLQVKENGKWIPLLKSKYANDTKYSLTSNKDSQGRELSPQQQEYFKDSKVVDEDGNLMVMYHGTESNVGLPENEKFSVFDRDRAGSHGTYYGAGFYFTPNMESAQDYAKSKGDVYQTYLDMKNPYIPTSDTINEDGTVDFAPNFYEDFENRFKDQLPQYWNDENTNKGRVVRNILEDNGYDGVINGDTYVVFNSNQIKNIDNTTPTTNPDIRYSLTKDNTGRELSEGQREFFKDNSKELFDKEGNLKVAYHTTTNPTIQFNEFNPVGTDYYKFGEDVVNYYTDSKEMSGSYADQIYNMADTKRITSLQEAKDIVSKFDNDFSAGESGSNNIVLEQDGDTFKLVNNIYKYAYDYAKNVWENEFTPQEKQIEKDYEDLYKRYVESGYNNNLVPEFTSLENYAKDYANKIDEVKSKMSAEERNVFDELRRGNDGKFPDYIQTEPIIIGQYNNEQELFRNLKQDIQKANSDNLSKLQYEGYLHITNPFVVDAENRAWHSVENKDSYISNKINGFTEDTKNKLIKLAKESETKYKTAQRDYENLTLKMEHLGSDVEIPLEVREMARVVKQRGTQDVESLIKGFNSYVNEYTLATLRKEGLLTLDQYADASYQGLSEELIDKFTNLLNQEVELNGERTTIRRIAEQLSEATEKAYKTYDTPFAYLDDYLYRDNNNELKLDGKDRQDIEELITDYEKGGSMIFTSAKNDFDRQTVKKFFGDNTSTNAIVKRILESNKRGTTNYDGIIMKNVIDYGGYSKNHDAHDIYVTFNSNQFKAVDNLNPTEDADIRYSMTSNENIDSKEIAPIGSTIQNELAPIRQDLSNITEQMNNLSNQIETMQESLENTSKGYVETYNEQRNENIPTRQLTEEDANTLQDALMQDEGYLRSLDEQANMNTENTKLIDRLTNNVTERLDLEKGQKETLRNIVKESVENGYSADEISEALQREFSQLSYEMTNQEAVDARKLIRDIPIKVSDAIKTDIADYGKWKSSNFGKINFSNSGSPVDSVYAELNNRMPYFFPSDIVNPTDQLLKIAEVANMATKVTETIDVDPSEFDNIADYIKNTTLEDQYNAQMNSQYDLVKNIQFDMAEDIAPTTIRTQESIDDYIENRDIAPVREDMGTRRNNSPLRDRLETIRRRFGEMITNRNYIIDETAKATGNRQIKFAGDMLNSVSGEAQYNVNNKQTDMNGNVIGKSVTEIFEPSKKAGLYEAFNDYLVQKSNIERHRVGKGSQVPEAVSQQLVKMYETENPQFKEWAKDVYKYFDNVLQEQVDAGLITQEQFNNYRGEEGIYRSYVPFYEGEIDTNRFFDNEGKVKPVSTLKRSTGNATDVNQLLAVEDSMAKQTYAYKRAIRQNELYKEIVNSLDKYSDAMDMDLRDNPTNLDDVLYTTPDGDKILSAYVDGEKMSAKISDELYNELSGDNEARIKQLEDDFSLITKPLQKVSNVRRNILTSWNPTFLARNAIKDIQDAVINSKHTGDMLKNYFGLRQGQKSAVFELREGKTKEAQQFLALYGADNLYGDYSNVGQKKGLINKFARANELIELAPRFAEFKASLQNGESVQEAIYNAREVTTNFGRGGYITKALNRNGFTFLNANVQGLNKLVRNLSGENGVKGVTSVVVKGAVFAVLPSILNELLYGAGDDKDEEYEALPDYIKDNYYLIKTEGNKFVRIPKGRINAAFGSLARRTVNAIEGDENAYEGALSNAWDQIGVGDLGGNNILAPMIQAFGSQNGEAWYGGDIVPTRLQNKPASEQTDAKIDAISNAIGELFGVSPYKVNYVLDQYTGGAGDILLPMITPETKSGAEKPHEYLLAPIKDAFVVNSTDDNKYAGEFYTAKDKAQIQSNSQYATDEDKLRYKYMSNISSQMSELYKERREVQADTTLGNKEKYAKVQAIQNEINNLAKEGLNNYDNFNNTENYSNIGDTEYYKNAEGEWTKVSDDEQEFTAGLNDAEKTAYYNVKNKINGITQDYTAKTKDLDKNDSKKAQYSAERKENITQTIVNSGLDNNTKAMIYSKYYSNKDTMNNVVNAGYNIDTYITALNDIEQIRNKYSQKNGYSTEERKQRTIAYINSLEMEIPQKAMMIRQYYTSFREYNNDIVNFVGNLNIPYEDKKAILEGTGMTVNGNNVSWK